MSNASVASDTRQTSVHQPWCDPAEHALAAGAFEDDHGNPIDSGCVGPIIEVGAAGGWLRQGRRGAEFILDDFLPGIALDRVGLRTMLQMISPDEVNDFRAVLGRAIAELDRSTPAHA